MASPKTLQGRMEEDNTIVASLEDFCFQMVFAQFVVVVVVVDVVVVVGVVVVHLRQVSSVAHFSPMLVEESLVHRRIGCACLIVNFYIFNASLHLPGWSLGGLLVLTRYLLVLTRLVLLQPQVGRISFLGPDSQRCTVAAAGWHLDWSCSHRLASCLLFLFDLSLQVAI